MTKNHRLVESSSDVISCGGSGIADADAAHASSERAPMPPSPAPSRRRSQHRRQSPLLLRRFSCRQATSVSILAFVPLLFAMIIVSRVAQGVDGAGGGTSSIFGSLLSSISGAISAIFASEKSSSTRSSYCDSPPCVPGTEDIMSPKEHGTSRTPVQVRILMDGHQTYLCSVLCRYCWDLR